MWYLRVYAILGLLVCSGVDAIQRRCIRCRSRGELGSCGDPFPFNATDPESEVGVHVQACPTGWCAKLVESNDAFKKEYGAATQRMCLQRPPTDYEERCAYTTWNYKKVYMCLCMGDLCNSATRASAPYVLLLPMLLAFFNFRK